MAIKSGYNGWDAVTRRVRGTKFYQLVKKGTISKPEECSLCGKKRSEVPLQFHAEEYGPTWVDYVGGVVAVCCYCHGMLHMRFRFPNRFRRYKRRISEGWEPKTFKNIGNFFTIARGLKDIEPQQEAKSGHLWLDSISETPYKGPRKVAVAINSEGILDYDRNVYTPAHIAEIEKELGHGSPE